MGQSLRVSDDDYVVASALLLDVIGARIAVDWFDSDAAAGLEDGGVMLTIGAFARLGGVSVRTLRHYEQVGVLMPEETDPVTGYRYYRARQLARLHRIQALKDLGLSLQQLGPLLDDDLSAAQLSGMLVLTRAQLADRVAEDQGRLARVEQRLRYIEMEDDMSIDMVIKHIPALRVAQVRYRGDEGLDFYDVREWGEAAFQALFDALQAASVSPEGSQFGHYEQRADGTLTPVLAVPIGDQPFADTRDVETAVLPAIDAVVTVYRGAPDHDVIGPIYGQMARYAEDHGQRVEGPGRDCVVAVEGDQLVMELQLPVESADAAASVD
jgi:DNA-binding transcriptional MerR regulator